MRILKPCIALSFTLLSCNVLAQTTDDLSSRVLDLEKRLNTAEDTISQYKEKEIKPVDTKSKSFENLKLNDYGDLKIYGDVKFNLDAKSKTRSLQYNADKSHDSWSVNGRVLIGFDGKRKNDKGQYAGFSVQPLADLSGKMNLDDARFFFGQETSWKIDVGRFEAYDMFPLNQDTFIEHSGNTSNELYSDDYGYIYMMKEGRGRGKNSGAVMFSQTYDHVYLELNTLVDDGSALYQNKEYHGSDLSNKRNVIYLRPVVSISNGNFSSAVGMEKNIINNAYGIYDSNGLWIDQSQRTGYGWTMTWNGLKTNPTDGIVVNTSTAYLDAVNEKDFSASINALWKRFELGYIYAYNKIDDFNPSSSCVDDISECWILKNGNYNIHTIHASYQIPNVFDMKNFNIYLGAYYSLMDSNSKAEDKDNNRYGMRFRFRYYF